MVEEGKYMRVMYQGECVCTQRINEGEVYMWRRSGCADGDAEDSNDEQCNQASPRSLDLCRPDPVNDHLLLQRVSVGGKGVL